MRKYLAFLHNRNCKNCKYKKLAEHYEELADRHIKKSTWLKAKLYHAWRVIREQNKGLKRLSRKVKRLTNENNNRWK